MTIDDVNEKFAIIGVGNKVLVMETRKDGSIREMWPFEEFKRLLVKENIKVRTTDAEGNVKEKVMSLANVWLKHKKGRQFNQLVYDMPGSVAKAEPEDYNGWQGFMVEPKEGDWSKNRAHIKEIICGGVDEHFDWVMNWLAALYQLPGRHAWTSIVLRGTQGTGKGHFANNIVGNLFGAQQYLHILGANQLTAEFNEHLSGKSYIFADESTWGGDPKAASKLKGLITEDTVPINRKFLKMVEEPSALHIIIASNNDWPIPIEPTDRRFTVFDVLTVKQQNQTYFRALRDELKNGGHAAMLYDMLEYEIRDHALRIPLATDAKSDITTQSLKPVEHWWFEILERGVIVNDKWPDKILKSELHENYLMFLERHHKMSREKRATETELGMFMRKFSPAVQQMTVNGKVERVLHIPSLFQCRKTWIDNFKWNPNYHWDRDCSGIGVRDSFVPEEKVPF